MCRKSQLTSAILIALGAGFVLSSLFESGILQVIAGLILLAVGLLISKNR